MATQSTRSSSVRLSAPSPAMSQSVSLHASGSVGRTANGSELVWMPVSRADGVTSSSVEGIAVANFAAMTNAVPTQVSLSVGCRVVVFEVLRRRSESVESETWLRGTVFDTFGVGHSVVGAFPENRVALAHRIRARRDPSEAKDASPTASPARNMLPDTTPVPAEPFTDGQDSLVEDIAAALLSWGPLLKKYLMAQNYSLYETIFSLSQRLHALRHQILSSTLSREKLLKVKNLIVDVLEFGNCIQGLDTIVRHRSRGYILGEKASSSMVKVFKTHFEIHERQRLLMATEKPTLTLYSNLYDRVTATDRFTLSLTSLSVAGILSVSNGLTGKNSIITPTSLTLISSSSPPSDPNSSLQSFRKRNETIQTFYIHFELSGCFAQICSHGEYAELAFFIFNKRTGQTLSENFLVFIDYTGVPMSKDGAGQPRLKTVFCEISESELIFGGGNECTLCLGVRIVRVGKLNPIEKENLKTVVKRGSSESMADAFGSMFGKKGLVDAKSGVNRGSMSLSNSSIGDTVGFRRPYACGTLDLGQVWSRLHVSALPATNSILTTNASAPLLTGQTSEPDDPQPAIEPTEYTIPLFAAVNEATFAMMQDQILNQLPGIELSSRGDDHIKVFLNLSTHASSVPEPVPASLTATASATASASESGTAVGSRIIPSMTTTQRLGFPERMHPHDSRNSIYLHLVEADLVSRGTGGAAAFGSGTTSHRNVQVTVQIRTAEGAFVENCIHRGLAGMESFYESMVYLQSSNPRWDETLRIDLEPQILEKAHLFLTFRNCTSQEKEKTSSGSAHVFAFAFLPLVGANFTVLADKKHQLNLYKYDPNALSTADYLKWPIGSDGTRALPLLRDRILVRTDLCSTLMTQSNGILNLLHWRQAIALYPDSSISQIVVEFKSTVPDMEIVKFLHGILDALIEALDAPLSRNDETGIESVVFDAIVHVCGIIVEPRFSAYEVALEAYVDKFLKSSNCWKGLLAAFCSLLESGRDRISPGLCKAINVWGLWIQIVVRSGLKEEKAAAATASGDRDPAKSVVVTSFSRALLEMIDQVVSFLGLSFDSATAAQTLILRNFMELLPYLERVYGTSELMPILTKIVNNANARKVGIVLYQLAFIHSLVRSPVFNDQKSRLSLVSATKGWIVSHLSPEPNRDLDAGQLANARICFSIAAELVEKLHRIGDRLNKELVRNSKGEGSSNSAKQAELATRTTLFKSCILEVSPLLDCFIGLYCRILKHARNAGFDFRAKSLALSNPFRAEIAELGAVIMSFIHFLPVCDLMPLLSISLGSYTGGTKTKGIGGLYIVLQSFMQGAAFPSNWANVNLKISKVVAKILKVVSESLKVQGVRIRGSVSAQEQLFLHDYFSIILQLLNYRWTATELFGPQLKRLTHRLDTDVRGEAGELFRYTWKEVILAEDVDLGSITFIRSLFGSFLELTMSPHPRLKHAAIELLFSILDHEYKMNGNFQSLEAECWDRLEGLVVNDGKGDGQEYRHFFVESLGKYFREAATSSAGAKGDDDGSSKMKGSSGPAIDGSKLFPVSSFPAIGAKFLKNVNRLLDLVFSLRDVPSDSRYNDECVWIHLKLIYFFREVGRRGLYIRYIHKLAEFHTSVKNFSEAALTLKLHADLLPWSHDNMLEPIPEYGFTTRTTAFERKEQLWMTCINGLEVSSHWERAIAMYAELAAQYEKRFYGYGKYAALLRKQADLIDDIMSKERYYPAYYRVGFYGKGFPPYIQGKQFIYKAGEWEKLASFSESILNKFVGASLLRSTSVPSEEILNGDGTWIQINAVNPEIDRQRWSDGDISEAWYNWEYDSERFSDIDPTRDNASDSIHDIEATTTKFSLSGTSKRKSSIMTVDNPNLIKFLMEPDLDPDTESALSKSNSLLDSIPTPIKAYYMNYEISSFSYSVPFRKPVSETSVLPSENQDPIKEFTELWTEKTLLLTSHAFPCLSPRVEVIKTYMIQLSPIENAIIAVRSKTRQLMALYKEYEENAPSETRNVNSFTIVLNGAVDAPVNGGIPMYRRAFLTINYNSTNALHVKMLSASIDKQVELLHSCLILHSAIVDAQLRPLHSSLVALFNKNFESEISRLGLSVLTTSASSADVPFDPKQSLKRGNSSAFLARIMDPMTVTPSSDFTSISDFSINNSRRNPSDTGINSTSTVSKLRGFFANASSGK
ncbi:hypothetical protein BC830DRAFT_1231930 [Chytriomyces sp. MP71]|nr:hypothetical protein BC830DRAFT_1231930 [Chytriomyces sp. MP71]